ncbi:hypothetical protein BH160DRAFT_3086 [Burkholderia sp. H160]|nr:hypothetical protein BH160DRAFT_3086 [Burkholderia sp. H160]
MPPVRHQTREPAALRVLDLVLLEAARIMTRETFTHGTDGREVGRIDPQRILGCHLRSD